MDVPSVGTVLGDVIPLAVGIAASPFPIIPVILLLFTPRARAASWAFLTGWFIGVLVATGIFTVLAGVLEPAGAPPAWASWTRIVLGTLLVALGIRQWMNRDTKQETPAWMRSVETASPTKALGLALLLSLANPKILLLAAAAGLSIGANDLPSVRVGLAVVVFALLASLTVAAPVLLFAVLGDRILRPLSTARTWLETHNAAIMAVVIVVLGIMLVVKGGGAL